MIIISNGTITGTADPDVLINNGYDDYAQLNGGDGDNIILDSFGQVWRSAGGAFFGSDVSLDDAAYWYTGSTRENDLITDDSIPNTVVVVEPATGQEAWFTVTVGAGETLSFDVDAAWGSAGTASSLDLVVNLYDESNNLLYSGDDSYVDVGSTLTGNGITRDPSGSWTNNSGLPVTVHINLGVYDSSAEGNNTVFPANFSCLLTVSVTGHETSPDPVTSLSNMINGGAGNDLLLGGLGDDSIRGGGGQDTIYAGSGDDTVTIWSMSTPRVHGGDGHDIIDFSEMGERVNIDLSEGTFGATDLSGTVTEIEQVVGSDYEDNISGDASDNTLFGGAGNDYIGGAAGSDVISGDSGDDVIYGEDGDDYLVGGAGLDMLFGGLGRDTIDGRDGDDMMTGGVDGDADDFLGGSGWDLVQMSLMADGTVYNFQTGYYSGPGFTGRRQINSVERLADGAGASIVITATSCYFDGSVTWGNTYYGNGGNDVFRVANLVNGLMVVNGGADNDTFIIRDVAIGDGDDYVGGLGIDLANFSAIDLTQGGTVGSVTINLAAGLITASSGSETFEGFENLIGSTGSERIVGTADANTLDGSGGDDEIDGGDGNDVLIGNFGDDRLTGGNGDDLLDGGVGGSDLLVGGLGDDTYVVRDVNDVIYEVNGQGNDTVNAYINYVLAPNFENLILRGNVGLSGTGNALDNRITGTDFNDTLVAGLGDDIVVGGLGNDIASGQGGADQLFGGGGDDTMNGNEGQDVMRGEDGADILRGGADADRLFGGAGQDRLSGEAGADLFFFLDADGPSTRANGDIITDFSHAEGDRIQLAGIDANSGVANDQAFAFIGSAAFSNVAGQLRYEQVGSVTYVEGDTNGDGLADFVVRLNGSHALVAADFVL